MKENSDNLQLFVEEDPKIDGCSLITKVPLSSGTLARHHYACVYVLICKRAVRKIWRVYFISGVSITVSEDWLQ